MSFGAVNRSMPQQRLLTISFYADLERMFRPDYMPTNQDTLHVRAKTTGEYCFRGLGCFSSAEKHKD